MPNWTYNYVELTGSKSNIAKFLKAIGVDEQADEPTLKFAHLVPEPPDLMDRPDAKAKGYDFMEPAWVTWRRTHWGTKWEASEFSITFLTHNHRELFLMTAWDCPRAYIHKFVDLANKHNVHAWWDAIHEGTPGTETVVAVKEVAV